MRYADITSGRVDLARLEESRGWLGSGPAQDPMSEAIDREIGSPRRPAPCPALRSDFAPAGMGPL